MKRKCAMAYVLISCAFAWSSGYACSCGPSTIEEDFEQAEVVFRGVVTSIGRPDVLRVYGTDQELRADQHLIVTFEILDAYKGTPRVLQYLFTRDNSGACGVDLYLGEEYVFFASADGWIRMCGGTFQQDQWAIGEEEFRERLRVLRGKD